MHNLLHTYYIFTHLHFLTIKNVIKSPSNSYSYFYSYFASPVFHFRDKILYSKYFKLIQYPHAIPSGGASHKKLFAQIHINETGVFAVGCLRRRAKLQGCDFLLLFWFNLAPDFLRDGSLSERDPRPPIKWNYNSPFLFYIYIYGGRQAVEIDGKQYVGSVGGLMPCYRETKTAIKSDAVKMCFYLENAICTQDFYPVNQIYECIELMKIFIIYKKSLYSEYCLSY